MSILLNMKYSSYLCIADCKDFFFSLYLPDISVECVSRSMALCRIQKSHSIERWGLLSLSSSWNSSMIVRNTAARLTCARCTCLNYVVHITPRTILKFRLQKINMRLQIDFIIKNGLLELTVTIGGFHTPSNDYKILP